MRSHPGFGAIIMAALFIAGCSAKKYDRISGDTPGEVAVSVTLVSDELAPDKKAAFTAALDLLRMTASDRAYASKFASVTPQMAQMLRGRSVDEVIQLANVYRTAIPVYPSKRDLARNEPGSQ
jgi:outer membrane murein-binding lipoprotein Lpp